mgnify:CR=1 FL=1
MGYQPQYYDSNIYMQSTNLILKAADMYYNQGIRQQEISEKLEISISTVSRLLKKAKEQEIVRFTIDQKYLECLTLETELQQRYGLREVIVAPIPDESEQMRLEEKKKIVALEGARYLQRVVSDNDVIGVAYGETVWYVYNYLNPCQRHSSQFVTLHGVLEHATNRLDGSWLVPRIAKAFGGKYYTINCKGLQDSREDVLRSLSEPDVCRCFEQFPKITVSISGVGLVDPHAKQETILLRSNFMSADAKKAVKESDACCDLMLRFLNQNGQESQTLMRSRVVGIPLESYRRIPNKIIVAAGREKWRAVLALLRGKLADTLIVDQNLAREVYQATHS